jgi:hypothetical protein
LCEPKIMNEDKPVGRGVTGRPALPWQSARARRRAAERVRNVAIIAGSVLVWSSWNELRMPVTGSVAMAVLEVAGIVLAVLMSRKIPATGLPPSRKVSSQGLARRAALAAHRAPRGVHAARRARHRLRPAVSHRAVKTTAVTVLAVIAAASGAAHTSASTVPRTTPLGMVLQPSLYRLEQAGLTPALEQEAFAAPGITGADGSTVTTLVPPNAEVFKSYGALKNALANGLPKGTVWVVLDLEHWKATPLWQQEKPTYTEHLAWKLVHYTYHSLGLKLVNTPAVDLLTSMGYKQTMTNYLNVVSYGIKGLAAGAARYGNAIDIQAQRWERLTGTTKGTYGWLVTKANAQAKAQRSSVRVLAGLSTCADGVPTNETKQTLATQTASDLLTDYQDTSVAGYWLNIPVWPNCPDGNASAGVKFVENVYE